MDFTTSRLPPCPAPRRLGAEEIGRIAAQSAVRSCDPSLLCVVDTTARDIGEGGDDTVTVFHCLANTREDHMLQSGAEYEEPMSEGEAEGGDEEEEEEEEAADEDAADEEEEGEGEGANGAPDGVGGADKAVVFPRALKPLLSRLFGAFPSVVPIEDLANVRLLDGTLAGYENAVGAARELAGSGLVLIA